MHEEQKYFVCFFIICLTDRRSLYRSMSVVVLKGSEINENTSGKSLSKGMKAIREKHIASELVNEEHITTEDILFSSSSAAADFVTGYSVSGPAVWKNIKGKSLREIESE